MKQFVSDKDPDFTYIKISSSLTVPFIKMANNVCAAFAILCRDSYTKVRFSRSNCSRTRSVNVYFTFAWVIYMQRNTKKDTKIFLKKVKHWEDKVKRVEKRQREKLFQIK